MVTESVSVWNLQSSEQSHLGPVLTAEHKVPLRVRINLSLPEESVLSYKTIVLLNMYSEYDYQSNTYPRLC
jgi:hypothetical protein